MCVEQYKTNSENALELFKTLEFYVIFIIYHLQPVDNITVHHSNIPQNSLKIKLDKLVSCPTLKPGSLGRPGDRNFQH